MLTVFFAYSHRDEGFRDEIETHLSLLKRQGIIRTWYDRRIGAGEEFDARIGDELETADLILLLVSSYFLASDYCFDIEMQRAMAKHEAGTARVIPIILHPCDWHSAPFGRLNALPKDGKPVSTFQNHHEALSQIAKAIREVAGAVALPPSKAGGQAIPDSGSSTATSRCAARERTPVRIARRITDKDRDEFLEAAFEAIANHFQESLAVLEADNADVQTRFRRVDANTFTAIAYVSGSVGAKCKIWFSVDRGFAHGIAYSIDPGSESSFNELLSLADDRQSIFLKAIGMAAYEINLDADRMMNPDEAAEYYWQLFARQLARS